MKKYNWIRKQCAVGMAVLMAVTAPVTAAAVEPGGEAAAETQEASGPMGPLAVRPEAEATAEQPGNGATAGQQDTGTTAGQSADGATAGQSADGATAGQQESGTSAGQPEAPAEQSAGTAVPQTGDGAAGDQAGAGPEITEEEIDAYFDNSVMVGDSIMLGFRNYAMRRQNTWLSRLQFLAAGSYSTSHALEPVTKNSLHPIYAGQKRQIWESIALMGAKKVFLLFGMNDLNISGIEGTCENYKAIAANIRALSPEAEIHLISMTYVLRGKAKNRLNNDNIRVFNETLRKLAADNGWGYVDLAPHLADEGGDLAALYCSDYFVHQTPEAYDVWCGVLREYAREQLKAQREAEVKVEESAVQGLAAQGPQGPVAAN